MLFVFKHKETFSLTAIQILNWSSPTRNHQNPPPLLCQRS